MGRITTGKAYMTPDEHICIDWENGRSSIHPGNSTRISVAKPANPRKARLVTGTPDDPGRATHNEDTDRIVIDWCRA